MKKRAKYGALNTNLLQKVGGNRPMTIIANLQHKLMHIFLLLGNLMKLPTLLCAHLLVSQGGKYVATER